MANRAADNDDAPIFVFRFLTTRYSLLAIRFFPIAIRPKRKSRCTGATLVHRDRFAFPGGSERGRPGRPPSNARGGEFLRSGDGGRTTHDRDSGTHPRRQPRVPARARPRRGLAFRGRPPSLPLARAALALALLRALPPRARSRAAIHRREPNTPSSNAGSQRSTSIFGK